MKSTFPYEDLHIKLFIYLEYYCSSLMVALIAKLYIMCVICHVWNESEIHQTVIYLS